MAEGIAKASQLKNAYARAHGLQFSQAENEFVSKIISDPFSWFEGNLAMSAFTNKALPLMPKLQSLQKTTEHELSSFLKTKGFKPKNPRIHSTYKKEQDLLDEIEKRKEKE